MEDKYEEAPNTIGQKPRPENTKISRRDFLKLAFGAAVATPFALKGLEKAFYEALIFGIKNPDVNDKAVSAALEVSESAPNSENPNYRPIMKIINEGIAGYVEHTGGEVFYRRNPSFRGVNYYADALSHIATASLLPTLPNDAIQKIKDKLPPEALSAYVSSDVRFGQFADLFTEGSGFLARIEESYSELFREGGGIRDYSKYFSFTEKVGFSEIKQARNRVEKMKQQEGRPVSASVVLEHFLKRSEGDLAQGIYDTAIFLKFMARNNPDTGGGASDKFNETWMRENIRDEYQGPTYTFPPKGEAVINLVGKPYHAWNLVALLQFLPVEVVRVGGIQRQLSTFKDQGLGKTRTDLQTLENLREVEQLLLSYSSEEQR